ncbi:hypothetical protein D3C86_2036490 [compost metagenome]
MAQNRRQWRQSGKRECPDEFPPGNGEPRLYEIQLRRGNTGFRTVQAFERTVRKDHRNVRLQIVAFGRRHVGQLRAQIPYDVT